MIDKIGGSKLSGNRSVVNRWFNGDNPGPLVIEVATASGCNHNCIHCAPQQFGKYDKKECSLDPASFKAFLKDFKNLGGLEVFFAGNGEPTLNPMLPEFIRYGHSLGLDMALSTNGVLLDRKSIEEIIPYLKWIRFSVNGGNAETYAKIHKCSVEDFEKLVSNMKYAVDFRNKHKHDSLLLIQFILYELNLSSIQMIVDIHEKIKTDQLRFRSAYFKSKRAFNSDKKVLDVLKKIKESEKIQIRWETFLNKEPAPTWSKCYGINFRANMDDKGNLFTCQGKTFFDCTYGNIHKKNFVEIWNSKEKKEIFSMVEQGKDNYLCQKGCGSTFDNLYIQRFLKEAEYE